MSDVILTSVKKVLGIDAADTAFDEDVLMHINTCFATLNQIGIGPASGFEVSDTVDLWTDFLGTDKNLSGVKTYVYLRTRLLFDPPTTSFAIAAMERQVEQLEWRLSVYAEEAATA